MYFSDTFPSFALYPDSEEKNRFHRLSLKFLKMTAEILDRTSDLKTLQLFSNKAGPAVSGEISLYMGTLPDQNETSKYQGIYVQISASSMNFNPRSDHVLMMARQQNFIKRDKRYLMAGTGGLNCFVNPKPNLDPQTLADWLYSIYFLNLQSTGTKIGYEIEPLGSHIPYQKSLF